MSDVFNRDEWERKLARVCGGRFIAERRELLRLLGDPPNLANVPFTFWTHGGTSLAAVVEPVMYDVFMQQAAALMEEVSISIEWDIANQAAADWARRYTHLFANNIQDRTQRGVGDAVASFFEDGLTIGDLQKRIERWYSPVRAEMIAVTEVTRAASEAEQDTARRIEQDNRNIEVIPTWQTNDDDLVCTICAPKNNEPITDGQYPPAHPRCRCFVAHEARIREGANV